MRERLRRARVPLLVAAVVLVAAVIGALAAGGEEGEALDPRNPAPEGSRAVAEILRREGVEVQRVTRSPEAARAVGSAAATVLVTDPTLLGPEQFLRLRESGADLVLVRPDATALRALAPGLRAAGSAEERDADPSCTGPGDGIAAGAGRAQAGGRLFTAAPDAPARTTVCYPGEDSEGGSWASTDAGGTLVTVLGRPSVLANESLAQQGNAALALATLGANPRLVWYQPDPLELGATTDAPSLGELLPRWVPWGVAQVVVALLLALLWRARRMGRLVAEPLPVVVRSAEAQEGRARLYRRARARDRAAATLRTAALRRLATRFDLVPGATPADLAQRVALRLDRPGPELAEVLLGGPPPDDDALVRLAAALDEVEAAVERPGVPT